MTRLVIPVVAIALVAAACASSEATGPPEINYGRDICIECGMVIEEARFAAAYRLDDGTEKTFDDLGGLIIHGRKANELDGTAVWVHDFETEEWVEATVAFFVPTSAITSPMGYGILAFADGARAVRFADDLGGEVLTWQAVSDLPIVEGPMGSQDMDMSNDT